MTCFCSAAGQIQRCCRHVALCKMPLCPTLSSPDRKLRRLQGCARCSCGCVCNACVVCVQWERGGFQSRAWEHAAVTVRNTLLSVSVSVSRCCCQCLLIHTHALKQGVTTHSLFLRAEGVRQESVRAWQCGGGASLEGTLFQERGTS